MIYAKNCYEEDLALTLRGIATIVDLLSMLDQGLLGRRVGHSARQVLPLVLLAWSFRREWLVILPDRSFHWSFLLRRGVSSTGFGGGGNRWPTYLARGRGGSPAHLAEGWVTNLWSGGGGECQQCSDLGEGCSTGHALGEGVNSSLPKVNQPTSTLSGQNCTHEWKHYLP